MKKLYLACPYSHPSFIKRILRFIKASIRAAKLMIKRYIVFSPLSHSVPIAIFARKHNIDFWLKQDFPFIEWCDVLYVYQLEGWEKSKGVYEEIKYAKELGKEIIYSNNVSQYPDKPDYVNPKYKSP
jgi:hypothetical protein